MSGPLKSYRFAVRCGSALDPKGKEGLACLTATLMAEGGTTTRSYKQILDEFFEMATGLEVQVDQELTVFYGTVPRDHAARYEAIVKEMMGTPGFAEEDFERVREDLLNYLKVGLRGSNDEEMAKEVLYRELYAEHPYGHSCRGTVKGLEAIEIGDVREFYARYCSELSLDALPAPLLPVPRQPSGIEAVLIEKADARGVAMSFGYHIPVRRGHPDYLALLVAQSWLGQHRSGGRLYDRIREVRGLNYGDYVYIEYFPHGMYQVEPDPNLARQQQIFQVWLRPVEPGKALFAFRLALYEIEKLRREGLSAEAFERTRNFLAKYVKLLLKTESLVAGYALDSLFYGTPEYTSYIAEGLAGLTLVEVNAVIGKYLQVEEMSIVAVGPRMAEIARVLERGEATPITYETEQAAKVLEEDREVAGFPLRMGTVRVMSFERAFED